MSKVVSGKSLRVGSRYRILAIDPNDPNPSMKVGAVVLCAPERKGCIDPENHLDDGMNTEWFADYSKRTGAYRTLVTSVAFVDHPGFAEPVSEAKGETDV